MGWLENVIVENKIGPNLTLRNCTVILKVPARRLHIHGVRFIDCAFEVKQELTNHLEKFDFIIY